MRERRTTQVYTPEDLQEMFEENAILQHNISFELLPEEIETIKKCADEWNVAYEQAAEKVIHEALRIFSNNPGCVAKIYG